MSQRRQNRPVRREARQPGPPHPGPAIPESRAATWSENELRLASLIGLALAIQIFVRYWGQQLPELYWGGFYYATAAARTGIPLMAALTWLKLPPRRLGFGWPQVKASELGILAGGCLLLVLVAIPLLDLASYQAAYSRLQQSLQMGGAFQRWLLFTLSTTVPWEILHRGFLLFGIRQLLQRTQTPAAQAGVLAILFTACFEVLFHLIKPPLESLVLLVGSPALSWLALRHRSLWVPLAIHLWIEFLWFSRVWL